MTMQPDPPVVDTPEAFTPTWLTAALRAGGLDARVAEVVDVRRVGTGQMASCFRIGLRGDDATPASVVAKVAAAGANAMAANGYRQELEFYERVAPRAAGRLARAYYGASIDDGARFVLLLEDLAPAAQGDQIAGCDIADVGAALTNLADLHGSLWEHPVLDEFAPASPPNEAMENGFAGFMALGTEQFLDWYRDRLDEADVEVLRAFAGLTRGFRNNRTAPRTILHGDYRLDNLLYRRDTGECIIVDWQTAGAGAAGHDLAYCITTSLEPEVRRGAESGLVAGYAARLRTYGVVRDDATLHEDYVFGIGHGIVITVLGAFTAVRTDRGDDMFVAMARRVCAAARDHDALARYA
jgi:aminoglycoside/choline kinase family phosphotransferase